MKNIIKLRAPVAVTASASAVGKAEHDGPLGALFDLHDESDTFGAQSFELAEGEMQRQALNTAVFKAGIRENDIDIILAGDLQNQCVASNIGLLSYPVPMAGLFGACSTIAEALALGALLTDGGYVKTAAAVASSHNCAAERQFRLPLEYGGQRTPTAQWTVTGAGAFILRTDGGGKRPRISDVLIGRRIDSGINDAANMGAAMAPAAADSLLRYFSDSGTSPSCYDMILTGDLGAEGAYHLERLMAENGFPLAGRHRDCGLLIYDRLTADVHSGGSGCGCSACVLSAYILPQLECGQLSDIIFTATGALMSPTSVAEGQAIPGIAHVIHLMRGEGE